jgi:hypothetical protein
MPALSGCTVMVLSGPFRVHRERRKSCLPNLGVVAPCYLGKPKKGSNEADSTCPLCGGGGGLGARPEGVPRAGEPGEKELCTVPPPLSAMSTDQVEVARFFREVFEWEPPWPIAAHNNNNSLRELVRVESTRTRRGDLEFANEPDMKQSLITLGQTLITWESPVPPVRYCTGSHPRLFPRASADCKYYKVIRGLLIRN